MTDTMAGLPEPRRRAYLAALGVPLFAAREVLPGALPGLPPVLLSPDLPMPEMAPERARAEPAPPVQPAADAARMALAARAETLVRPVVTADAPVPAQSALTQASMPSMPSQPVRTASASASVADVPRFTCRLLRATDHDFVLLDLGEYPDLGPGEAALWRNIVQALQWQGAVCAADFAWPLGGGLLGQNADAARATLAAWLGRDVPAQARLLVFGETLAVHVERPHRLLPALSALLTSPLAKRQLWRELNPA